MLKFKGAYNKVIKCNSSREEKYFQSRNKSQKDWIAALKSAVIDCNYSDKDQVNQKIWILIIAQKEKKVENS